MEEKITVEWVRRWAADQGLLPTPGPARTASREVSFTATLSWASPHLARHRDLPVFGSPEWVAEPDQRRKTASAVQAAILWALHAELQSRAVVDAEHAVAQAISDTQPSPASSARYVSADAAQPPFDYPPARRSSAA